MGAQWLARQENGSGRFSVLERKIMVVGGAFGLTGLEVELLGWGRLPVDKL